MKINSISFKNLFAYGEELQTINYTDTGELILLKGMSGAGKSAILSLPCLMLYGRIEKVPPNSIANRINKHGYINGTVVNGSHTYTIERTFVPNTLKVYKDGVDIENIGIKDAQTYIEQEIIDIPQITFNNMISISMKKFKSFLTMNPADRKQIIDRIFDLEIVNAVYEDIKKDTRETGNLINNDNAALYQVTQSLTNAQSEMNKLQEKLKTQIDTLKIEENNKLIEEYNQQLIKLQEEYQQVSQQLLSIHAEMQSLNQSKITLSTNIKQIQDKLHLFNQEKCPTCGTHFNSDNFIAIKNKLNTLLEEQKNIDVSLQNKNKELVDKQTANNEYLNKINQAVYDIKNKQQLLQTENIKINASIQSNSDYQGIQNIIDNTQERITLLTKSIQEKTEKLGLLQKLLTVYSIEGVKQQVINNHLPILNKEIDEHLELLGFPYQLQFDSKFDSHITEMGIKVPVQTLSDGEMTRVDLVVLCSLLKLLKLKYPSINILSIDELVSFLDVENSQVLLKFIKEFAVEMKLNIFVVSHVNIDTEYFDRCIEVTRSVNGFSQIKEENLMQ